MRKEIEMMRVLRVPPLGKLVIEVGGERYENMAEITHPEVRQRLLAAVGELITVAGGYQNLVDAGAAPQLGSTGAPPRPPDTGQLEADLVRQRERFVAQLEAQRDAYRTVDQATPEMSAADLSVAEPIVVEAAQELSIVEQIDALLQKHVAAAPELAGRSIHLTQNPSGGLRIEVDGQVFERPREITDVQVQRVIKLALKDWESS